MYWTKFSSHPKCSLLPSEGMDDRKASIDHSINWFPTKLHTFSVTEYFFQRSICCGKQGRDLPRARCLLLQEVGRGLGSSQLHSLPLPGEDRPAICFQCRTEAGVDGVRSFKKEAHTVHQPLCLALLPFPIMIC